MCCRHGRLPSALEKAQSALVQCSLIGLQELISQPRLSQDVCSVRSSLSPFELLLQAAQETEAFVFHKECDFIFIYSQTTLCQLESHPPLQTTSVPLIRFFSVSLLDLQVCLCYTDVFALTFHQFLPRTTLIIQRINCVALFFRLTQV